MLPPNWADSLFIVCTLKIETFGAHALRYGGGVFGVPRNPDEPRLVPGRCRSSNMFKHVLWICFNLLNKSCFRRSDSECAPAPAPTCSLFTSTRSVENKEVAWTKCDDEWNDEWNDERTKVGPLGKVEKVEGPIELHSSSTYQTVHKHINEILLGFLNSVSCLFEMFGAARDLRDLWDLHLFRKESKKIHQDDPRWSKMVPKFYIFKICIFIIFHSYFIHISLFSFICLHLFHICSIFRRNFFHTSYIGTCGASSRSCLQLSARASPGRAPRTAQHMLQHTV